MTLRHDSRSPGGCSPISVEGGPHRAHHEVRLVAGHAVGARALRPRRPGPSASTSRLELVAQRRARARASRSPGPRLAEVAGTLTRTGPVDEGRHAQASPAARGRGVDVGVDDGVDDVAEALERGRGVLEAVAGDGDRRRSRRRRTPPPRARCSSPATPAAEAGSTKTPSRRASSRCAARIWSSLTAANRPPDSSRGRLGELPRGGVADPDRGRLGLRVGERLTGHERRRALGLEAAHHRAPRGAAEVGVLLVAEPVGRDVAGVADRQQVVVGGVAEEVDDLEGRGLLALRGAPG